MTTTMQTTTVPGKRRVPPSQATMARTTRKALRRSGGTGSVTSQCRASPVVQRWTWCVACCPRCFVVCPAISLPVLQVQELHSELLSGVLAAAHSDSFVPTRLRLQSAAKQALAHLPQGSAVLAHAVTQSPAIRLKDPTKNHGRPTGGQTWFDQYAGLKPRPKHPSPVDLFGTPAFAAGRAFSSTIIDALMCESEFQSHLLPLLKQLVLACRSLRLRLVPVVAIYRFQRWQCPLTGTHTDDEHAHVENTHCISHGHTYLDVADALMREWGALPLGLYRRSVGRYVLLRYLGLLVVLLTIFISFCMPRDRTTAMAQRGPLNRRGMSTIMVVCSSTERTSSHTCSPTRPGTPSSTPMTWSTYSSRPTASGRTRWRVTIEKCGHGRAVAWCGFRSCSNKRTCMLRDAFVRLCLRLATPPQDIKEGTAP